MAWFRRRQREERDTLRAPSAILMSALGAEPTAAGVTVDGDRALAYADVYACIRVIADAGGSLPLHVYQRTQSGSERIVDTPTARLLEHPAPTLTQSALISGVLANLNGWGNAYLAKYRDASGAVTQLGFIQPWRVWVGLQSGEPVYRVTPDPVHDQVAGLLSRRDLLHVKALSTDGLVGLSPVRQAREAIATGIAMEEHGARFFTNGAVPSGTLEVPGELGEEAAARLRSQWQALFSGPRNAHRTAVLEGGATYKPISIPLEDAQFLDLRKLSTLQVCRAFRVPPHMVGGELVRSMTYSNVEQESIDFTTYTLRPWLVAIEQALAADEDLFPRQSGVYPEFLLDALLRADTAARYQAYSLAVGNWMTVNEIRRLENLPPVPGGDELADPGEPPASQIPPAGGPEPDSAPGEIEAPAPTPDGPGVDTPPPPARARRRLTLTTGGHQ